MKAFIVFSSIVLAAALLNPLVLPPKWPALLTAWGIRYWFMPMLAFVCTLIWIAARERPRGARLIARAALVLMIAGIAHDWRHPRFIDLHFGDYARQFSDLSKGCSLTIPLDAPAWSMTLTKH